MKQEAEVARRLAPVFAWPTLVFTLAVLAGLGAGALAGLVNGLVTTRVRIPPFVATLAMLTVARGLALHYTDSRSISGLPAEFGALAEGAADPPELPAGVREYIRAWGLYPSGPA